MLRGQDTVNVGSTRAAPDSVGFTWLAVGQGTYYFLTGLWPLVNMRSFEAITGPKVDRWLVQTVGWLVTVVGGALTMAGVRQHAAPEVPLLGVGSAVGLAGIEFGSVARGRISRVYLLDAVLQVGLVAGWAFAWPRVIRMSISGLPGQGAESPHRSRGSRWP